MYKKIKIIYTDGFEVTQKLFTTASDKDIHIMYKDAEHEFGTQFKTVKQVEILK